MNSIDDYHAAIAAEETKRQDRLEAMARRFATVTVASLPTSVLGLIRPIREPEECPNWVVDEALDQLENVLKGAT